MTAWWHGDFLSLARGMCFLLLFFCCCCFCCFFCFFLFCFCFLFFCLFFLFFFCLFFFLLLFLFCFSYVCSICACLVLFVSSSPLFLGRAAGTFYATLLNAYSPTVTNPDEVKDKFYDDLDSVISATPRTDKHTPRGLQCQRTWEGMIGTEEVGKFNSNCLLLLRKYAEHELLITTTVVRLQTRNKTSWMYPRSKHWILIDYVIMRRKDTQYVRMTKNPCGADCWKDHSLVVSKLNLCIQPARRPQGKKVPKILDISKLKQDSKRQAFVNDICSRFDALEHSLEDPDENWRAWRDTVYSSAMYSLGPVSRKHQDCFDGNDEETQGLLEEKHQKTQGTPKTAYSNICCQSRLGSETCKTLCRARRMMKSSPLQTERIWSSFMHLTIYGPQSLVTTLPFVQMELVFRLTQKLSWKDGLILWYCP